MSPSQRSARALPVAALRRFEVVDDGGTLIRLDACGSASAVVDVIEWLGAAGVSVHHVVELPTDPTSPAHAIADSLNAVLAGAGEVVAVAPAPRGGGGP